MQTKKLSPEEILQKANQIKDRFSASKGKADQIIADNLSEAMNGMLGIIQSLLQSRAMDESTMTHQKKQIEDLQAQVKPAKPKVIPKSEKP